MDARAIVIIIVPEDVIMGVEQDVHHVLAVALIAKLHALLIALGIVRPHVMPHVLMLLVGAPND